jgi:hypothetical protein
VVVAESNRANLKMPPELHRRLSAANRCALRQIVPGGSIRGMRIPAKKKCCAGLTCLHPPFQQERTPRCATVDPVDGH